MANVYVNVNFYGHGRTELSGLSDERGIMPSRLQLRREYTLKVVGYAGFPGKPVSIYNYNSVLGPSNEAAAGALATAISGRNGASNPIYLITGYSAGGTTALYFARAIAKISNTEIGYIGLADAAFYTGESADLMTNPGVTAKYPKNYFQTKGNAPDVLEIHGPVTGFTNFDLNQQVTATSIADQHEQAVIKGNFNMNNDVIWCLGNYQRQ